MLKKISCIAICGLLLLSCEKEKSETELNPQGIRIQISKIFEPFNIDLVIIHDMDSLFQYEVIKGVRIYEEDERIADEFEERVMKRAGDLIFQKRILEREIMEAIEDGYFEFEYQPGS